MAAVAAGVTKVGPRETDLVAVPARPVAAAVVAPLGGPVPREVPLVTGGELGVAARLADANAPLSAASLEEAAIASKDPPGRIEGAWTEAAEMGAGEVGPPRPRIAAFAPCAFQPEAVLAGVGTAKLAGAREAPARELAQAAMATAKPMLLHAALVAAIPALGADELPTDVAPSNVARRREREGLQAAVIAMLGRPARAATPLLGDAVLALRPSSIDPRLSSPEEAGPLGLMAPVTVPPAVALDVDLPPSVPQAPVARTEEAAVVVDGELRTGEGDRAMKRAQTEWPKPRPPVARPPSGRRRKDPTLAEAILPRGVAGRGELAIAAASRASPTTALTRPATSVATRAFASFYFNKPRLAIVAGCLFRVSKRHPAKT